MHAPLPHACAPLSIQQAPLACTLPIYLPPNFSRAPCARHSAPFSHHVHPPCRRVWNLIAPPSTTGLLGLKKSKSWKVTAKWGGNGTRGRVIHRPYMLESLLAVYYGTMAGLAGWMTNWFMMAYCILMACVFLALAFGDLYM
jgi:hypothetical protein